MREHEHVSDVALKPQTVTDRLLKRVNQLLFRQGLRGLLADQVLACFNYFVNNRSFFAFVERYDLIFSILIIDFDLGRFLLFVIEQRACDRRIQYSDSKKGAKTTNQLLRKADRNNHEQPQEAGEEGVLIVEGIQVRPNDILDKVI